MTMLFASSLMQPPGGNMPIGCWSGTQGVPGGQHAGLAPQSFRHGYSRMMSSIPSQTSFRSACQRTIRVHTSPINAKRSGAITIIEVKYAPDPDLHAPMGVRQQALDQHADLKQSLLMRGWGKVTIFPVIRGNAGTMTATADDALQALGVGTAARMTLLKSLAVESVRRTAEIWKPRLTRAAGRPPEAVFSPTPAPDPDAPDTSNCNPPDATTPPGNTMQPASATPAQDTTAPTQSPDEGSSTPSNIQYTAHSQPARHALREAGTTDAPWQVVTRSRARASATRYGPASNSLNLLCQQDQPSKRQRNRFTVLCDDTAPPQAMGLQTWPFTADASLSPWAAWTHRTTRQQTTIRTMLRVPTFMLMMRILQPLCYAPLT